MKKCILFTTILIICECIISCEKIDITSNELEKSVEQSNSEVIPVEAALASLDKLLVELYGETKFHSEDYTVEVFGGVQTKSAACELPDTTLYYKKREWLCYFICTK